MRRRAVESISYINDDPVRRIIDRAYSDSDPHMRESAVFAMGRSADIIWADTVLAELQSKSPAMRYEAARATGELQLKRAVPALTKMAEEDDPDLQIYSDLVAGPDRRREGSGSFGAPGD